MVSFKSSLLKKKVFTLLSFILVMTSLFGYIIPASFSNNFNTNSEESVVLFGDHPLNGISDNVVNCTNDNRELHEIYLCGATAERLLAVNIPNLKQIIWSKLQDPNCAVTQTNCPKTSPSCGWDEVSTNTQFNASEDGEYKIFVQYNDDSKERFYFNIYANGLAPSSVVTNIDCGTSGSITINNVPSTYEYSINNGATWQNANVFPITSVGSYDVQIRNKSLTDGCIFNVNDIAVGNNSIDAVAEVIPITCNTAKGGIKVDINNASSSYVYEIRKGGNLVKSSGPITASTYTFTDLDSGSYDINVTLASISNCSWSATEVLPSFQAIQPNAVVTKNVDCSDGEITISPTGGNAPFEYSLDGITFVPFTSTNQTTVPITTAGSYTVTIKDNSDCEITADPIPVIDEPEIAYTIIPKDITCNGNDDGSITIDVTNGQGYSTTFSLNGTTFQTSNVFSNLSSGSYTITIRKEKAGGLCDVTHNTPITINPSTVFTASAAVTQQINCINGSATIETTITAGGTAPFEFSLNGVDFQPNATFTGLGAGTYTITVKDDNGCTTTANQTINGGSDPTNLNFSRSNTNCITGATDVQVSVENGNGPFTYQIIAPSTIDNDTDDTFTALVPGTYTFEIDDDGCKIIRNYTVPEPTSFDANTIIKKHVSCFTPGTTDGEIEVNVSNFASSFTVVVENSAGTDTGLGVNGATISPITITGLAADTYTIKISDTSGPCEYEETQTVKTPSSALSLDSFNVSHMNCGSPGLVTIEASGGWGNYNYAVLRPDNTTSIAQSNKTITGLTQIGTHTIILKDINGCIVDTQTFDLEDVGGPISVVDQSASNYCYSTATKGELKIDVSGGEAPFFYTVNNGTPQSITGGTFTLSNLTPDDYIIKVIGNNGCETTVADTKISGQLFALPQITKPLGCGATPDALINVIPEEGYPPYTYTVNGNTTPVTMPYNTSVEGLYTFTVTDSKGCSFTTDAVDVKKSPPLDFSNEISNTTCGKDGTGSVKLIANGGTPPYQYAFSTTPFTPTNQPVFDNQAIFTGLDATTYYLAIKDDLGCTREDIETIIGAEDPIEATIEKTDIQCDPLKGGNIWGNMKVRNITNATGLVTISLVRIQNRADYEAGNDTREWTYRRYENIDLTSNSNYLNASKPSLYGSNTGFDIRLYWATNFVVRIEDEKGCFWESPVETITAPTFPNGVVIDKADPVCADGATFKFEINDDPTLVGPFEARVWPYDMVDSDGDGIEDDITNDWRPFDDVENPSWDGVTTNSRIYTFTNSTLYGKLLFGVNYSVIIRDKATGCIRWRRLGIVNPPSPGISVDAVPQSVTCYSNQDGKVQLTVNEASAGDITYRIYHASNPKNTKFHYGNYYGSGHVVTSDGINPTTFTVPEDLRVGWYVVEIEDATGCSVGERFLVHRPKTKLKVDVEQVVQPTCNKGGQIAITATGGWDNEKFYNQRNKIDQNWHPHEYALVLDSQTPTDSDFGSNSLWANIVPSAYDGTNNVYRAYVLDASGCTVPVSDPITLTQDLTPIIDNIDVTNRCTSTDELYNVVATLSQPGTNPTNTVPVYIWNGEVTTSSTKTLGPGHHTLEVRDENGCSDTQNIHIYPQLVAKSKITKTVDCDVSGLDNGEMLASAYGGSGNFEYTIDPVPATYAAGEETNTTGIFTRLEPGINYTYSVNDLDNSCGPKDSPSLQLITPADPQFEVASTQSVSCNGANDGKIIIKQIDGVDNLDVTYEYSIDGGTYQTSYLFENLSGGTHDINIRSSKNCVQTITGISISEPSPLSVSTPTISNFLCTSDNKLGTATIEATISGGNTPYKYSFNGSSYADATGSTISFETPYKIVAQDIIIDVIDSKGCPIQANMPSGIPAAQKVSADFTEIQAMSCINDAQITINGIGGSGNYSVVELPSGNLINGTGSGTITIPAGNPGTYVYLLTDTTTGCTDQVTYTIAPFNTIDVSASHIKDITCFGETNGEISFTATGFGTSFSYAIFNNNDTITPIHSVANSTATTVISYNTLGAGTFYVVVQDDSTGCLKKSEHISIQSPTETLDFTFDTTQQLSCSPGSDAQVTATPIGGWGTYEFELVDTNSGTTIQSFNPNNVFSGLTSGINYELTLRDAGGCTNVKKVVSIPVINDIIIDPTTISEATSPTCPNGNDGTITVIATGGKGTADYKYILNNQTTGVSRLPQLSNIFNDLVAGSYTITVTDGYGCDATSSPIVLVNPSEVIIDAAITQEPGCIAQGEITVSASGGSGSGHEYKMMAAPASYTLTNTWSNQHIYGSLPAGTYEFIARDGNSCESSVSVVRTINTIDPLQITNFNTTNTIINCSGDSDAVLIAEASGGLGGYQYQLERDGSLQGSPQDSGIFENLGPGDYRIVATSGLDCTAYSDYFNISEPPILNAIIGGQENIKCYGEVNGSVTISATGGVAPYSFIISSEPEKTVKTNVFEGLAVGEYIVFVQDNSDCQTTVSVSILGPTAPLSADITQVDDEVCSSYDNGFIEVTLAGGTAPYEYNLVGFNEPFIPISGTVLPLNDLDGGFYTLYIKDANGCEETILQEIKVGSDLTSSVTTSSECANGQPIYGATVVFEDTTLDTSDIVYILDDADPENPNISNSQDNPEFTNISSGEHTISIVHGITGCVEVKRINIEAQDQLTLTFKQRNINEIAVEANGGDGNYTYYFDDEEKRENFHYINTDGNYNVRVVDGKGCETSITVPMKFIDLVIPKFFTPNGDGVKDTWELGNVEAYPNLWGAIYDRYGRLLKYFVKQSSWDGTYEDTDLPAGDYWYIIKLNGKEDNREFIGNVTVYR